MLETDAERLAFKKKILHELSEHIGGPWKEVWCEAQPRHNEMVFWILLYEDSDLEETHRAFCGVLMRHIDSMRPLEAQLCYEKFTSEGLLLVDLLRGNEAVFSALNTKNLGASGSLLRNSANVFRSTDSKR